MALEESGSLALDWFATASRSIDALEEKQAQAEARRQFHSELYTTQQKDHGDSFRMASSSESSDAEREHRIVLPIEITAAQSIPRRVQLLQALKDLERVTTAAGTIVSAGPALTSSDSTHLYRVALATYALALETLFDEADRLQDSTWYWNQVQDSNWAAATYLMQTLPSRLVLLARESYRILADVVQLSNSSDGCKSAPTDHRVSRNSIVAMVRQLRKTPDIIIGALWPHATASLDSSDERRDATLTASSLTRGSRSGLGGRSLTGPLLLLKRAKKLSPLSLTVHEAHKKRQLLAERRAQLAQKLGDLALTALDVTSSSAAAQTGSAEDVGEQCYILMSKLRSTLLDHDTEPNEPADDSLQQSLLQVLSSPILSSSQTIRTERAPIGLSPPSRLSIIWPSLILYPALLLLSIRITSRNRKVLSEALFNAKETAKGFFRYWVVQPLSELLDTIRVGDAQSGTDGDGGGSIVTKEGRRADLESLERMVTQYAVEKRQISADDAVRREALRRKVREGDLDVVMLAYENQLKSPFKSLTVGSLPRLLLIQVQKAKYDLAVAMSGIDHLLKSQALLFGAVGIAPAMGILWAAFKASMWLVRGRDGAFKHDNMRQKQRAWASMRRVDRMLTASHDDLSPMAYGTLLLELSALRKSGTDIFSSISKRRGHAGRRKHKRQSDVGVLPMSMSAGSADVGFEDNVSVSGDSDGLTAFLQDVRDLERTAAATSNRHAKSDQTQAGTVVAFTNSLSAARASSAAVERMWRCWGSALFVISVGPANR